MDAITYAYRERRGEWVTLDGGAMRLRVYGNGNAHLEVHPEMAWRLNAVLASIYPTAIAEPNRRRPRTKAPKDFVFFSRPLPFPAIECLTGGRFGQDRVFSLCYDAADSPGYDDACGVLETLGGTRRRNVFITTSKRPDL